MLTASADTDYHKRESLDQFDGLPKFWFDSERGMVSMRNGWGQDAMLVHMENRIDQYYAGHETPQHGDFQIWADGIPWSSNLGAYRDCSFRAMVTVDGLAGVYCPVSGDWMPGDIALFRWGKGEPSHVGIIGDHPHGGLSIIHASNLRNVVETSLIGRLLSCVEEVYRPRWSDD